MVDYRYRLRRVLPVCSGQRVLFVMLNPSTADDSTDDPTIRRCKRFAQDWGYGELQVGNLFALRGTDPLSIMRAVREGADVIGPENDVHLIDMALGADLIVCAWGASHHERINPKRAPAVRRLLADIAPLWRFAEPTAKGDPRHPLYRPSDEALVPYV